MSVTAIFHQLIRCTAKMPALQTEKYASHSQDLLRTEKRRLQP